MGDFFDRADAIRERWDVLRQLEANRRLLDGVQERTSAVA
jgi:hypothetical protein